MPMILKLQFPILIYKRKKLMSRIKNYSNFLNEAKAPNYLNLFKKDIKNIIDDMFDQAKSPKYSYDNEGYPNEVEFEIVKNDYIISYDKPLKNEYSLGVLKKRNFEPELSFIEKYEDETGYHIIFEINKLEIDTSGMKSRKFDFEKDSSNQLIKKLKKEEFKAYYDEIQDILDERGVDFDFNEEEDDYTI